MSDPNRRLDSANVDTPASRAENARRTGAEGQETYPPYLLLVKAAPEGPTLAHIDGPHTSSRIDLGGSATGVIVKVTHNATSTGPNLDVVIERA